MHAAGVVISQKPVEEYVPLSLGSDGSVTTQFVATTLEELGTFENGLSGASHLDGDPGCREACKLQFRKRDQH